MITYPVKHGQIGVNINSAKNAILIQVEDDCEQIRVVLTIDEAENHIQQIQELINKIKV